MNPVRSQTNAVKMGRRHPLTGKQCLLNNENLISGYESNVFEDEIAKVTVEIKKKTLTVAKDELPRTFIAAEHLSDLPPVVGLSIVTEGNSSVNFTHL